jgi:hypothetical protein
MNAFLGWAALILITLFMGALLYVDVSARRLVSRLAQGGVSDATSRSAAETALRKGFWARLTWLRSTRASLDPAASLTTQRILRVYSFCWATMLVLIALWVVAAFVPKL